MATQKISPYLWFDSNAEEAVEHYLSMAQAMMTMQKIDVAALERAHRGA